MWYEPRGYPGPFDKSMKNPAVGTRLGKRVERAFPVKLTPEQANFRVVRDSGVRETSWALLSAQELRRIDSLSLGAQLGLCRLRVTGPGSTW